MASTFIAILEIVEREDGDGRKKRQEGSGKVVLALIKIKKKISKCYY